jgi:hypothetical protein
MHKQCRLLIILDRHILYLLDADARFFLPIIIQKNSEIKNTKKMYVSQFRPLE